MDKIEALKTRLAYLHAELDVVMEQWVKASSELPKKLKGSLPLDRSIGGIQTEIKLVESLIMYYQNLN